MTSPGDDATIREIRGEITEVDRAIVEAMNTRIELVARLKEHKEKHGIAFRDPDRERQLVDDLVRANGGPLSEEGVRDLVARILELTKREVG